MEPVYTKYQQASVGEMQHAKFFGTFNHILHGIL